MLDGVKEKGGRGLARRMTLSKCFFAFVWDLYIYFGFPINPDRSEIHLFSIFQDFPISPVKAVKKLLNLRPADPMGWAGSYNPYFNSID